MEIYVLFDDQQTVFFFKEINTFFPCYNRHNYLTALNCNDEDSVGSG